MQNIYLDNAATTRVSEKARHRAIKVMENVYGNPSSMHNIGLEAEKAVKQARKTIAEILGCSAGELYFTSGGTESNNTAIFGAAAPRKFYGKRIITTRAEHPSVLEPVKQLEEAGFEIVYASLNQNGQVDMEELKSLLGQDTCLVSIHHINNETGAIQNIEAIGALIKQISPDTFFHVDAVQSFCKHEINVAKWRVDLMSVTGHKIGGIKGAGALYIKDGLYIKPLIYGGGQEKKFRSGTENTVGIAAFGAAAEEAADNMDIACGNAAAIKKRLLELPELLEGVHINGDVDGSPYIVNYSFDGVKSEVLLHSLEAEGVYVSAGSACSSNKKSKTNESAVLIAYGLTAKRAESALRISLSPKSTMQDAETAIAALQRVIPFLRKHGGVRR